MRASIQRDLILKIINENHNHMSAEEIYFKAKENINNISLGTVYRNINQLCDNNLVRRIKHYDKIDRFDNLKKVHSHFLCNKCGHLEDIYDNFFTTPHRVNNNLVTGYDLVFKGICSKCQKEED